LIDFSLSLPPLIKKLAGEQYIQGPFVDPQRVTTMQRYDKKNAVHNEQFLPNKKQ